MVCPKADVVWLGWPNAETDCAGVPKADVPWPKAEVALPKPVWPKAGCPNAGLLNAVVVVPPNADGIELVPKADEGLEAGAEA